jgi:hypothetical protein
MANQVILPRALDANGDPESGAKATFYDTGTSTPQTVYSDTALSTAHTSPLVADANGVFAQVFSAGTTAIKVALTDSADVALPEGTLDPVAEAPLSVSGASQVSFTPTADIAQTDVQAAIEETYSESLQNVVEDTSPQLGGALDTNSKQIRWSKGADIASATALVLGSDGNSFDVTGTTAITSITTVAIGMIAALQFDGILTLTHHATDLVLPSGANITTAAGDIAVFTEYATGDWRCVSYQKQSGLPLVDGSPIKAWALFDGTGTPALTASSNIASITDTGVGDYTLNFTTAMASADFAVLITVKQSGSITTLGFPGTRAVGSVQIITKSNSSGESSSPQPYDADEIHVAIFQ